MYDHWEGNFDEARILVSGILKVEFLAQTDSASSSVSQCCLPLCLRIVTRETYVHTRCGLRCKERTSYRKAASNLLVILCRFVTAADSLYKQACYVDAYPEYSL